MKRAMKHLGVCLAWASSMAYGDAIHLAAVNQSTKVDAPHQGLYQNYSSQKVQSYWLSPQSQGSLSWTTPTLPQGSSEKGVLLDMALGFGSGKGEPAQFTWSIDGKKILVIEALQATRYTWRSPEGYELTMRTLAIDHFDDSFGRCQLYIPAEHCRDGQALRVEVRALPSKSHTWLMLNAGVEISKNDAQRLQKTSGILLKLERLGIYENVEEMK